MQADLGSSEILKKICQDDTDPLLYVLRTQMETATTEHYWQSLFIRQICAHNPRSSHQQLI